MKNTQHLDLITEVVVRSLPEHELWTELSDNFREMAHRYKDGEFDYRTIWDWFQKQQNVYRLEKIDQLPGKIITDNN